MFFNTAPKPLSVGKLLVVTFLLCFGLNAYSETIDPGKQDCINQRDLQIESINSNSSLDDAEKQKQISAAKNEVYSCYRRVSGQQTATEKKAEKERKNTEKINDKCEEVAEKFNDTYNDFGKSCEEGGLSSIPSKCYTEINKCQGTDKSPRRSSSRRKSTSKTCNLYSRADLDGKLSDHQDQYDKVQDLIQEISEANTAIQETQSEQADVTTAFEEENRQLTLQLTEINERVSDALEETDDTEQDSTRQLTQQIEDATTARQDLLITQPQAINDGYSDAVTEINDGCINTALADAQEYRNSLAAQERRKRRKKDNQLSSNQFFNSRVRSCNQLAKSRLSTLARTRDRQLQALERQVERSDDTIRRAEAALTESISRAQRTKNRLLERGLKDFQNKQNEISELVKRTNNQLAKLQISIDENNRLIAQKQKQLQDAQDKLNVAEEKLNKAKAESGDRNIESSSISEIFEGHNESRRRAQAVVNNCKCGVSGDRPKAASKELCNRANTVTGTKVSAPATTNSSGSGGSSGAADGVN